MFDPCPVCASPFTAYVRDVPTRRTNRQIKLFTCLDCHSFWNPSGYREDDAQLAKDLEWGFSVADRNKSAATRLFAKLETLGVHNSSVAEIGCGIGTLLSVAKKQRKTVVGFDVNDRATDYARQQGIDARSELWTAATATPKIDLYLCISVLEHTDQPRPLIRELCTAAARNKASLFISVPFVEREKWEFILDPNPRLAGTPFFDNDVHVMHFTIAGLKTAMREFGQKHLQFVNAGLWHGVLATPSALPDSAAEPAMPVPAS